MHKIAPNLEVHMGQLMVTECTEKVQMDSACYMYARHNLHVCKTYCVDMSLVENSVEDCWHQYLSLTRTPVRSNH